MTLAIRRIVPSVLVIGGLGACTVPTDPADEDLETPPLVEGGDIALGRTAFSAECASCHASRDGFDLAHFSYSDTTVLRRALGHVDSATAVDIVAYVRSLEGPKRSRDVRLFQPGDEVLASDIEFALRLFGTDAWPTDLTTAQLRAMNPREVPVAVAFPMWSSEDDNLDWMPDEAFPAELLGFNAAEGQAALDAFYETSSIQALVRAVVNMTLADRRDDKPASPCVLQPIARLRANECFEARRWIATLSAQFMLRHDLDTPIHTEIHDSWWDVGHVARATVLHDGLEGDIPNALENWVSWMYLGWAFHPERHASHYLGAGFARNGLGRHATYHILRAQVARLPNLITPYVDTRNVVRYAQEGWVDEALTFAYGHLLERLADGDRPVDKTAQARTEVNTAYNEAVARVTPAQAEALAALRDQVLAAI